jgi:hypothetical protein
MPSYIKKRKKRKEKKEKTAHSFTAQSVAQSHTVHAQPIQAFTLVITSGPPWSPLGGQPPLPDNDKRVPAPLSGLAVHAPLFLGPAPAPSVRSIGGPPEAGRTRCGRRTPCTTTPGTAFTPDSRTRPRFGTATVAAAGNRYGCDVKAGGSTVTFICPCLVSKIFCKIFQIPVTSNL